MVQITGMNWVRTQSGPGASQRRDGVRHDILRAASTLFRARGFHATGMRDIATALGMTVAAAVLPLLVIDLIGFPVTAALMFLLVSRAFGSRAYILNAVIGIAFGLLCWYGFSALGVQLRGLFPPLGF